MTFPTSWANISGTNSLAQASFVSNGSILLAYTNGAIYSSTNGTTFTQRVTGSGSGYSQIIIWAPELGLFIAAISNQILSSPDGITWTVRATNIPYNLFSMAWSASLGLLVAAGRNIATSNGNLVSSPDGITWTVRRDSTESFGTVVWAASLNKFLAEGSDSSFTHGTVFTSTNGTTWTATNISTNFFFIGMAWSPTLNLFVAQTLDFATFGLNDLYTSPDGVTWTLRTIPNNSRSQGFLSWLSGPDEFVIPMHNLGFYHSTDGLNWLESDVAMDLTNVGAPAYFNSYIYLAQSSTDYTIVRGLAQVSLIIGSPAFSLPFTVGSIFLDEPSYLYGFAGTLSGTIGAYAEGGADLYGFSGNLDGTEADGATTTELYGFAGVVAGYGGAYAELYGFAGTVDGLGLIPDTFAAELSGFAGVLDGRISEVAQATADLYGFAGNVAGLGGADSELYGFAGVVEGTANVLATLAGELYGFAGSVDGAIQRIEWAHGELYGFAGRVDSGLTGAAADLYGFAGVVEGILLMQDANGQVNLDGHDAATVLNVRTTETTRYRNVRFMHLITVGGQLYGVRTDGLYALKPNQATDAGATSAINATITTKETYFDQYQSKRVPYLYANSDAPGQLKVTPYVDGAQKLSHLSRHKDRKVHLARGVSGRYHHYVIEGIVNLQGVELLPELRQRRVK